MKFNHADWDIDTNVEEGSDGIIYGNYVNWDEFRDTNEDNLLDYFGVSIPWGEVLTMYEYFDFIQQEVFCSTSIVDNWGLDDLEILEDGSTLSNITLQFPDCDEIDYSDIISAIFDYYEVPSGTEYEYELPESLQYFNSMLENDFLRYEYEYYQNYPIEFKDYETTISDIQSKINIFSDDLTKKSLILSSLIISESLLKSVIVAKIPTEPNISQFSKDILSKEIEKRLRGSVDNRNTLFKQLFDEKAPKQAWNNLRNSLAHDIESATISNDQITYKNLKDGKEYTVTISCLFDQQLKFFENLKTIIDNTNTNDSEV